MKTSFRSACLCPFLRVVPCCSMGKKARLACVTCGVSFKQRGGAEKGSRFCNKAACGAAASGGGGGGRSSSSYNGDVPPAFPPMGSTKQSDGYGSDGSASSFSWEREVHGGGGGGGGNRGGTKKSKKRKKSKKQAHPSGGGRPVESDPRCRAVLALLDGRCEVVASPGDALDAAVEACAAEKVIAVDCEGVCMSRVGAVTVLQVAAGEKIFLFDVQALGEVLFHALPGGGGGGGGAGDGGEDVTERAVARPTEKDGEDASICEAGVRAAEGRGRSLKAVLEDPEVTKLMFDCRVDSDALFHQHGIRLGGVYDVQLADVAARRRASQAVSLLSGMPRCAARHLGKGLAAAEASLAALDGARDAPPDAASISRVTEHLKNKVKELYAPDLGGDGNLWALRPMADDVRRYAALDVWLLQEMHAAMEHAGALDEEWTKRVWKASEQRTSEYRDLDQPVLQFRDRERAVAPDL